MHAPDEIRCEAERGRSSTDDPLNPIQDGTVCPPSTEKRPKAVVWYWLFCLRRYHQPPALRIHQRRRRAAARWGEWPKLEMPLYINERELHTTDMKVHIGDVNIRRDDVDIHIDDGDIHIDGVEFNINDMIHHIDAVNVHIADVMLHIHAVLAGSVRTAEYGGEAAQPLLSVESDHLPPAPWAT